MELRADHIFFVALTKDLLTEEKTPESGKLHSGTSSFKLFTIRILPNKVFHHIICFSENFVRFFDSSI